MKGKTSTVLRTMRRCVTDSKLVKNGGTSGLTLTQRRDAKTRGIEACEELARRASTNRDREAAQLVKDLVVDRAMKSLRERSVDMANKGD